MGKKADKKLKWSLVLQSFAPLFVLLFIRHVGHFGLIRRFASSLLKGDFSAFQKAFRSPAFGDVAISTVSFIWVVLAVLFACVFRTIQYSGFEETGEKITIVTEKKDSGVLFLATFVLPLLVDDVSTLRALVFFCIMLAMTIYLFMKSDLFYQSPVLTALNYNVFDFQFQNPRNDVRENTTYIGCCKGALPNENEPIKRRYIADNVFLIYNVQ